MEKMPLKDDWITNLFLIQIFCDFVKHLFEKYHLLHDRIITHVKFY